jgi:7,8-dihydropterin-6-yl-methyl-4-(beta-D-ribofuranosyl)aminobenzene 5'-phosphate synthase
MPQLVKGGKWVFGWCIVGQDVEIRIPPEAHTEYGFQAGETVIITPGSRCSGGFGIGKAEKLANSPLQLRSSRHDLSLVLQTSQGLVVVCGCCHAGLLNTLAHMRHYFYQPLKAVIGGTHLEGTVPENLDRVVEELSNQHEGSIPDLYLNHCTGEVALFRITHAFGEKVHPCPAGLGLSFD